MPTNKQSTAVKKAWSQANKLHKAIQLEGWDDQGVESTPGLARRYNSLIKKGLVQIQGAGSKNKTLAYSKWLAEMALGTQATEASEQPQISSKETNPAIVEDNVLTPIKPFAKNNISLLENLSQTCRQFQITPNQLVAHVQILEDLQVAETKHWAAPAIHGASRPATWADFSFRHPAQTE